MTYSQHPEDFFASFPFFAFFFSTIYHYDIAAENDSAPMSILLSFHQAELLPECDCEPSSERSLAEDVGAVASRDAFASDEASVNFANVEEVSGEHSSSYRGNRSVQIRYIERG